MEQERIRVICVSMPLFAHEAIRFARQFHGTFTPMLMSTGRSRVPRHRGLHHQYQVVRVPSHDEDTIPGHELVVETKNLIGVDRRPGIETESADRRTK